MAGRKQFDIDSALDAAMRVFWERGYADTTLDDLGAATGLGRGSIYGTFGSKNALFLRALDRYARLYGGVYDEVITGTPDDPEASVRAFFDIALRRFADTSVPDGCLLVQSVAEGAALEPASRDHARDLTRKQYLRLLSALRNSSLPASQRDDLARYFVAVNQGLAIMHRAGATSKQLAAVVERAITSMHTTS